MAASVSREIVLPLRPEELWPALTEAEQLAEWFAPDVEIDARPGGAAVFRWEDGARRAVVEEVEEGTRLRVVETAAGESLPATAAMLGAGDAWQTLLARLRRSRALAVA